VHLAAVDPIHPMGMDQDGALIDRSHTRPCFDDVADGDDCPPLDGRRGAPFFFNRGFKSFSDLSHLWAPRLSSITPEVSQLLLCLSLPLALHPKP